MRKVAIAGLVMTALIAGTTQAQGRGALDSRSAKARGIRAQARPGNGVMTGEQRRVPLDDTARRALLVDSYVTPHRSGDDGPGEFFHANGVYQRGTGWGVVFEGLFEIRDAAVCIRGEDSAPICRRVVANADGTYTFINTADGASVVMTVTPSR